LIAPVTEPIAPRIPSAILVTTLRPASLNLPATPVTADTADDIPLLIAPLTPLIAPDTMPRKALNTLDTTLRIPFTADDTTLLAALNPLDITLRIPLTTLDITDLIPF